MATIQRNRPVLWIVLVFGVIGVLFLSACQAGEDTLPEEPSPVIASPVPVEDDPVEEGPRVLTLLPQYLEWYDLNPDFIGWIRIPGTTVDHPVLQESPDELDFYLSHNIYRERCSSGVPFIWYLPVDLLEAENVAVYGHNFHRPPRSPDEDMVFSPTVQYKDADFFRTHTVIEFDTRYEERTFELVWAYEVAVVNVGEAGAPFYQHFYLDPVTRALSEDIFDGHMVRIWDSAAAFYEHVRLSQLYTIHDSGVTVSYGDIFVRLVTCTQHPDYNTRLVIVARLVS